ncbi:MAG: MFS transporter [Streptococcaceae bacterium]|jgi:MFS family permease|nr:MFS transporter [Streptococcaceae bacterium]
MDTNTTSSRIWTPTFSINTGLNLIYYTVFYLLTVIIGTVAMTQDHASAGLAGILSGIFIVGGFVGRLWTGNNVTRIGLKPLLYGGTLFYIAMTLLYFVTPNIGLLMIVRFLHGIAFGISATTSGTLAGLIAPRAKRGEAIGYYALSVTLASAVGPFLSIFIYHAFNYTVLLIMALALLVIALIGIFFLRIPKGIMGEYVKKPFSLSNYFEKTALPISLIGFLVGIAYSSILTFLAGFSAQAGLVTAGSLFYVIYAIVTLGTRPITGRLFDARGDNFMMFPTFIFFGLSLLLTGFSTTTFMLLAAGALIGLGYGSFGPFGQAIAIRHADISRIGVATSTFFGLFDMGVGFGPFILGFVQPATGYRGLYFLCAAFTVVIIILYWFMHGRHARRGHA